MVKMLNTGQACISPNRMFVQRTVMQPFLDELVSRVTRMRAGNGLEDGVAVGPLVGDGAIEKVDRQVQDAVSQGPTLLRGGHRLLASGLDRRTFYPPPVLPISEDRRVGQECGSPRRTSGPSVHSNK